MSSNFTGVTFANQKVTPSDDAIIRRAILPDGILTGCELSYSGSTLTMAAGQLMICGRQVPHPATQRWAVVDATSGYARLLLTIDLTRTATKEVFDQVVDTIEYATAVNGFPALVQTDINGAGTRYQCVACVVSLGAGGITGIVSQLGDSKATNSYPIGAIYISADATSPASLFGGTWEQIKDKFLLSAGNTYAAGATGGEASHKLTTSEIPSHTHNPSSAGTSWVPGSQNVSRTQFEKGGSGAYALTMTGVDEWVWSTTGATGGGGSHNNMPPYLAVYMWKRIA